MAALTLSEIQAIFKNVGKLIYLAQLCPGNSDEYRQAMMTTVREAVSGSVSEFGTFTNVLAPLGASVNTLAAAIDQLPTQVKAVAEQYLTKIVGPKLGLASGAAVATVNAALVARMTAVTATVAQSGSQGANASGFAMYFYNNWSTQLPQAASPNIEDAWIEVGVV